jgi:hypothetical protein
LRFFRAASRCSVTVRGWFSVQAGVGWSNRAENRPRPFAPARCASIAFCVIFCRLIQCSALTLLPVGDGVWRVVSTVTELPHLQSHTPPCLSFEPPFHLHRIPPDAGRTPNNGAAANEAGRFSLGFHSMSFPPRLAAELGWLAGLPHPLSRRFASGRSSRLRAAISFGRARLSAAASSRDSRTGRRVYLSISASVTSPALFRRARATRHLSACSSRRLLTMPVERNCRPRFRFDALSVFIRSFCRPCSLSAAVAHRQR